MPELVPSIPAGGQTGKPGSGAHLPRAGPAGYSWRMRSLILRLLPLCLLVACVPARDGQRAANVDAVLPDPRIAAVEEALETLPAEVAGQALAAFRAETERFLELLEAALEESDRAGGLLALVDKTHALSPDYEPADLVSLDDYPLLRNRDGLRLRKVIMDRVLEMDGAAKADGARWPISSSYRSWAYQDGVYQRNAKSMGQAEADRVSARPGHSQHQLGTVMDLGSIDETFADTAAGRWMAANAWKYGFSMSYPRGMEAVTGYVWEPWHFRYITVPGAALERDFFDGIQQWFLQFLSALPERRVVDSAG